MATTLTPCNPAKSAPARLNWIDALRGLTMISVVMVHVLVSGFGLNPDQSALAILRGTFTLPLFFFVSGFFLYRPPGEWTRSRVLKALRMRVPALLCGTILFASLYFVVMRRENPLCWLTDGNFVEYWYTISLFQIFIWYLVAVGIARLTDERIFFILTGCAFAASVILPFTPAAGSYWCHWWLNEKTALYFQFFATGMFVRSRQGSFFSWLERPYVLTLLIACYTSALLGGWTYKSLWESVSPAMLTFLREELARYAGLLLVLRIFYSARTWFDGDTPLLRTWRLIGCRTLDIYFLHYFFVPRMRWAGLYLMRGNTLIPELIAAAAVSIALLAVILPLSRLLRSAPILRNLLGAKPMSRATVPEPRALTCTPRSEMLLSAKKMLQNALSPGIGIGYERDGENKSEKEK